MSFVRISGALLIVASLTSPSLRAQQCPPAPPPPPGCGGAAESGGPSPGSPDAGSPARPAPGATTPAPDPSAPAGDGPASPGAGGGSAPGDPSTGPLSPAGRSVSAPELESSDLLHWRHWWFLESARYLDLRARIQGPPTADGRSVVQSAPRAPSRRVVATEVVPRLIALADTHRADDVVASALLALGRLADVDAVGASALDPAAVVSLRKGLGAKHHTVAESAALGLGLLGDAELVEDLVHLVRADADGQRLVGGARVSTRLRSFAAYGLALAAQRIEDPAVRQVIALELAELLEQRSSGVDELEVALLSAFGLCPLPERPVLPIEALRERAGIDAALSRASQVAFLTRWVTPTRAYGKASDLVRCHAAVALARLAEGSETELRLRTVAALAALAGDRAEGLDLRAAAALALGNVVCAGDDPTDRAARRQLVELVRAGQPLERRMASIAAARAASRPGGGDEPLAGRAEVRRALVSELVRGHSGDRPWIALALGVMDEALHAAGVAADDATFDALSAVAAKRRGADDSAALALALALSARDTVHEDAAAERVAASVDTVSDPDARGHLFVAAALLHHEELRPVLRAEVRESVAEPVRLWSAAVSLALLGEHVSRGLVPMLEAARSSATQVALASAIGHAAGSDAVEPLLALLDDAQATSATKAATIDALGALCDLERLPWRHALASGLPYFAMTPSLVSGDVGLLELPW
jgi:hypothetical protein